MRYTEWFILDASILYVIAVIQHNNELHPFHEHVTESLLLEPKLFYSQKLIL